MGNSGQEVNHLWVDLLWLITLQMWSSHHFLCHGVLLSLIWRQCLKPLQSVYSVKLMCIGQIATLVSGVCMAVWFNG